MTDNEKSELLKCYEESASNNSVVTIGTSVDTGFEWEAVDECKEKLGKNLRPVKERGKIYFNVSQDQLPNVQNMRSIDNVFIVADVRTFVFDGTDKEANLQLFKDATHDMKLEKALTVWKKITSFNGKIYPTIEEHKIAKETWDTTKYLLDVPHKGRKRGTDPSASESNTILRYRVTCERTGKHCFESNDVSRIIGGELQERYHWLVDLSTYHLEVVCKLVKNELITQLRVTHESKHRRNIAFFGPTTLRATICYNLLRLASPQPGDIIVDPMCGGGSISIEASFSHPHSYSLGGDNHPKAISRTKSNVEAVAAKSNIDIIEWSVSQLPIIDSCIDVVVTDMPFGRRSGSMTDNRVLYKQFLLEMGRVVKPTTGRLVLLTYDRRSFNMNIQATKDLFRVTKMLGVNIGGLQAAVYVLKRTNVTYDVFQLRISHQRKLNILDTK